ncbi:MAG TPA: carbon-nitrogen hydrolase family protein [Gammaproteobacteria bacterium]|nr:carbon-nitrogen hydrolase family protein [Gammaproteobacteria bacterium]
MSLEKELQNYFEGNGVQKFSYIVDKMNKKYLKVAAFQGHAIEKNPSKALDKTLQAMEEANNTAVDILCMPESYLHGYLKMKTEAAQYSMDLQSSGFSDLCSQFKEFQTTLLLGLNERYGDHFYNTTVVIENGTCLGFYRKAYTYAPFDYFSLGTDFPVFEKRGIPYGIVICYDINFLEPARILALKGAKILFCPMWNCISKDAKMLAWMHTKNHFIARATDNHCWIVASDIILEEDDAETCPGYASIISDKGDIVSKSQPFVENLLTYSIPIANLLENKEKRLRGNQDLFEKMVEAYSFRFNKTES